MKTSDSGLNLLEQLEGRVGKVYKDSAGYLTVGEGHLVQPKDHLVLGQITTSEQDEEFLRGDVAGAEWAVNNYVKIAPNQNQFDALVCLVFNIGCHAFQNSTLLKEINIHASTTIIRHFWLEWDHAGGLLSASLEHRRIIENNLFGL